jgi:hypothetical protein
LATTCERQFHGVPLHEVQVPGIAGQQALLEVRMEGPVALDRPHLGSRLEERAGQRPQAGADLDHRVARAYAAELERLPHDVSVDQEVLAQEPLGRVAEPREEVAGFGGGERHRVPA